MPYSTTAGQFLCAANTMRESIVDYARAVEPLQQRLDTALKSGKRTKRVTAGISVTLTDAERVTFDKVKDLLATSATLALPDDSATRVVCSDASDNGWSVIVTQVSDYDAKIPVTAQQHKLLTCLSGTFKGSQLNWTVIEMEAYPIVVACEKLDYLLMRPQQFRLFCDHRNLIHVFAPHVSIKKHIRGKLLRWALKLMPYRYIIEHVDGVANVWADILSRWAGQPTMKVKLKRFTKKRTKKQQAAPRTHSRQALRPLVDEGFVWPSLDEIRTAQPQKQAPVGSVRDSDGVLRVYQRVRIPRASSELTQRMCVIAHCGAQGHRGETAMLTRCATCMRKHEYLVIT
ncbi:hypothetical protein ON010_g15041 [Phytophthora cinnamomi]|nr:hypothetical protein ON010_g15041 [Phytophthora cinnamomi]